MVTTTLKNSESLGVPFPDHPLLLTALLALLLLSGRATQSLESLQVVHTNTSRYRS